MSLQALDRPVVSALGLRSVNFFNGRLLTGDDMRREQAATEARMERLGRALGDGVANGFEVAEQPASSTKSAPVVTVKAGLAVSRSGVLLELPADVDIALSRNSAIATAGSEPGNLFADCQPYAPGTYTAGAGVYLLTVAAETQGEGRAPVSGLQNTDSPCNVALSAEALRFRLVRLALPPSLLTDKARLRNRVAYLCFGDAPARVIADPFGAAAGDGLLDTLRSQTLTDDEVPLATIGWSISDGVQFVDLWSVRRRPATRDSRDAALQRGEAMVRQLHDQLADIRKEPSGQGVLKATDRFERLAPAGLLVLASSTASRGFDVVSFFDGIPHRDPVFVEGSRVAAVLDAALGYPPVDLSSGEALRLYLVRENQTATAATARYVLFVSGHVPYAGDARADLALWDYANYAER